MVQECWAANEKIEQSVVETLRWVTREDRIRNEYIYKRKVSVDYG